METCGNFAVFQSKSRFDETRDTSGRIQVTNIGF